MELQTKKQEPNQLFSRTEYVFDLSFDRATPSKEELAREVAKQTKADENNVVIRRVDTQYGFRNGVVTAYVYDNNEMLKKMEKTKPKKEE